MDLIRRGDRGEPVRDVQHRLLDAGLRIEREELDGTFGPSTEASVAEFQRRRGLPPDGIVGPDTWGQLVEAGYRIGDRTMYLRSPAFRGDDVRELQRMLNALGFDAGKEDGIFGASTSSAVRDFQRNVGARVDGIVGLDTVRSLEGLRPTVEGPGRALVREAEAASRMGGTLAGSVVAVDAGHGPSDPGVAAGDLVEAEVVADVASSLCAELERRGARAVPLRSGRDDPSVSDRAQRANASGATVCVSLHLGGGKLAAGGAVCCHFGSLTTHSPMGRLLAESILAELVAIGLGNGGVRPLTISILRETRMPAVQVELAVLTNADDVAVVRDPAFGARAAVAVADGIERFLGTGSGMPAEAVPDSGSATV